MCWLRYRRGHSLVLAERTVAQRLDIRTAAVLLTKLASKFKIRDLDLLDAVQEVETVEGQYQYAIRQILPVRRISEVDVAYRTMFALGSAVSSHV